MAREMLGPILLSIHNLTYYQRLLADARSAIEADRFTEFRLEKLRGWISTSARAVGERQSS
jgi:queuine tRNA-ribosyltransferase